MAATVADLQAIAESISVLTKRLQKTLGVVEGHVERIATSIELILRDYGGTSYRQYRNLVRDLDGVAAEVARLSKSGEISPKVVRILDASLLRIRKRDFFMGRKLLERFGKLRAQAREREGMVAEYREGYRSIEREISRLRGERDRLKSVRRPPLSEDDVSGVKALLERGNRALTRAWMAELHEVPSHTALATLVDAAADRRLSLPVIPRSEATALLNLLMMEGPTRTAFGSRGVHGLLEALGYSDAKLAHLIGDGRPLKAALQANLTWLKAVTAPGDPLPRLSLDLPLGDLRERVDALIRLAQRLSVADEAREALTDIAARITSGEVEKAQEADRMFRVHGEAARMAWEGSLAQAVDKIQSELDSRLRDLAGLTPPERLGHSSLEG